MPSKVPTTVEGDAEPWLVALIANQNRQNLFEGIKSDNVPYMTLQVWARQIYGSRGRPVTSLEQAEHDLYEKVKAKVPILHLQRQLAFVGQLEQEQKNDEEAQRSKKTTREDLLSKSEEDAPSSKRRKITSKAVADDDDMPPPLIKRRHISRADDEPSKPQPLSQAQLKAAAEAEDDPGLVRNVQAMLDADPDQEANNAEIARILAEDLRELPDTSSDAVVAHLTQAEESGTKINLADDGTYPRALHGHHIRGYAQRLAARRLNDQANPPRPRAYHCDSDSDARQVTANNRKKPTSGTVARKSALPDEEDLVEYNSDDRDAGLPPCRSQNALAHQIALEEARLNLDRGARAGSVAASVRLRAKKVVKDARRSATHNQRVPGLSLILRGARAGRESNQSDADDSDGELPEHPTAHPIRTRPNSRLQKTPAGCATLSGRKAGPASADDVTPPSRLPDAVLIQANRDSRESNTMTMRRIQIGLHAGQNADNSNPPPLPPSPTPHGRAFQDYDEEYKPVMEADATLYKWVGRKRYRVIRISTRNNRGEEVVREELCLSDAPDGCKSPPPRWQKFKLQGLNNGRVWSEDWKPKPDRQPKGAQYYMVPAGEVINRPRLPDLQLARKHGMEEGAGSEYVGGPSSLAGSQAGVGMGGASVMGSMAPPSTVGRESKIFSVRSGQRELNHNSKHGRSVVRTTPVSLMAGDRDAPERTLAQRLGLDIVETASVQDGPMTAPSTCLAPRLSGQASRRQLTLTNVAILEAQTGQLTHPPAVVRGKLRDVASGDEGRTIWLGHEMPRRPASIALSESLRGASQAAIQTRAAAPVTSSARNGNVARPPPLGPGITVPRDSLDFDFDIPEAGPFISLATRNVNYSRTAASVSSSARNGSSARLLQFAPGFTVPRDPRDFEIDILEDDRFISRPQTQREQELEAQLKESKRREADMKAELAKLSGVNVTGMEGVDDGHVHSCKWVLGQGSQQGSQARHGGPPGGQRLGGVPHDPPDSGNCGIPSTMRTGIGIRIGGSAYGGSQRSGRGGGNFRHGDRGGSGGFGGRGGGSQAGGSTYGSSQRGGNRGGGGSQLGGSQRGAGGGGGGPGKPPGGRGGGGGGGPKCKPQEGQDPVAEYERMRKEAEEKYPFQDA